MTLNNLDKAPFPFFGGKSKAAPTVWSLLGDVDHYCEPFAGSLAVLLGRPHPANRPYHSETVNDLDGLIVNAWRAIQMYPDEVARHASWPVMEADKTARQIAFQRWRNEKNLDLLAGDPFFCDPMIAGWWIWGVSVQIGAVKGPWTADPVTGRITKQARGPVREPGVYRDLPHVSDNGQGVASPGLREPGVLSPHAMDADNPDGFHPVTMPELTRWMHYLSARLRHVRVLNGDWSRLVTKGTTNNLAVRKKGGVAGVFLDPPYSDSERKAGLYHEDGGTVAVDVLEWCKQLDTANPKWRVVLAGYDGEHNELANLGWTCHEWYVKGWLTGGMANVRGSGHSQQSRERLWASPQCLSPE
jgi:hypothetical protein